MTDLTEQLYAGTLPTGHYYFNNGVETYIVLYKNINSKHLILQEPEGLTVLSEVPSYEEWQEYKNANDSMFDTIKMLNKDNGKLEKENTKLKGLLEECRECVDENLEFSESIGRNRIQPRNKGLLKRIDEVLK